MKRTFLGLMGLILIVGVFGAFIGFQFLNSKASNSPEEVIFEVSQGKSFQRVARELQEQGLIRNSTFFSWYARLRGQTSKMKVGEYGLRRDMTPSQVLSVIVSGKSIGHPFTIAEGLNMFEIAELYETQGFGKREDFLKVCLDPVFIKQMLGEQHSSLEGYLFPETYQLTKFTSVKELIQSMVRNFQEAYKSIEPQIKIKGFTKHQIVTLASIIEKETGAPEERPRISSVFHNRLVKGMMLQTDPTIIYGLADIAKKTVYKIGRADILRPTKYNTYVIKGLPPGPIANPGRLALLAAVQPEATDYLYFVSQNDGTHIFSQDYEGHQKAVKKFQLNPKAREGKSWRDLNKKKDSKSANP